MYVSVLYCFGFINIKILKAMAKVLKSSAINFIGTFGNMIYYLFRGKLCVRKKPKKYRDAKSTPQVKNRNRFQILNAWSRMVLDPVNKAIWNKNKMKLTPLQCFTKKNNPAFNKNGEIEFYEKLHFSLGNIDLPMDMKFEMADRDQKLMSLNWNPTICTRKEKPDDKLRIVAIHGSEYSLIPDINSFRIDSSALFTIPGDDCTEVHLFAYFFNQSNYNSSSTYYQKICF
jgi:hypothetical protein